MTYHVLRGREELSAAQNHLTALFLRFWLSMMVR
jgi:hypothetical protein